MKTIILDNHKFTITGGKKYHYNSTLRRHLHQYIWEKENSKIPKGYEIHHIDFDTLNNNIENLKLLSKIEHAKLHSDSSTWSEERWNKVRNNLDNIRDMTKEWHSSEEGKEWHKSHYENMKEKLYEKVEKTCKQCDETFLGSKGNGNIFCSNKCKSKWRRHSGIDDIIRICKCCGNEFKTNKYSKAVTCGRSCCMKLRHRLKDSPTLQE